MNRVNPADTGAAGARQAVSYLLNDNLTSNPANGIRQSIGEAAIAVPAGFLVLGEGHRSPSSTYDPGTQAVDWAGRPQSIWCREYSFRNLTDVFFGLYNNARTVPNVPHHPAGLNFAFADGHLKFFAVITADQLQGKLPYVINAVPNQQGGSLVWQ
jgi:prepilin-type processing-associated H-X9-DG protein